MRELYPYYERELSFMRESAARFAQDFPEVAGRLDIERYRCEDPHVERLIEAFCLLAARIHHRLDSEFPEITQSLLNLIFPHYLRPTPAMSIAQFRRSTRQPKDAMLIPVSEKQEFSVGEDCHFRTCYPVDIWPIDVVDAQLLDSADLPPWGSSQASSGGILLRLKCDPGFDKLKDFDRLRFWLDGATHVPYSLYELIFNWCHKILLWNPNESRVAPIELQPSSLRPVGFEQGEAALPSDVPSFVGFRCLHEYFAFPEKFLFFDVCDLGVLKSHGCGERVDVLLMLANHPRNDKFQRMRHAVSRDNFRLGCTPVINLFEKWAEPIRIDQLRSEYPVIPDAYHLSSTEMYSIGRVSARSFGARTMREYRPFFDFRHVEREPGDTYWHATRRPSERRDAHGSDVFISLLDYRFEPKKPPDETLLVEATCTNGDLPSELAVQHTYDEISFPDSRLEIRLARRPTRSLRPPLGRDLDWRIISHLALSYLSIVDSGVSEDQSTGADALREMLELYNYSEDPGIHKRIKGVQNVQGHPTRARLRMRRGRDMVPVFCHGMAVEIDFEESAFDGSGIYLFGCVLERFLALYSPVNSFVQLTATTERGRKVLRQWPPRAGEQALL